MPSHCCFQVEQMGVGALSKKESQHATIAQDSFLDHLCPSLSSFSEDFQILQLPGPTPLGTLSFHPSLSLLTEHAPSETLWCQLQRQQYSSNRQTGKHGDT